MGKETEIQGKILKYDKETEMRGKKLKYGEIDWNTWKKTEIRGKTEIQEKKMKCDEIN